MTKITYRKAAPGDINPVTALLCLLYEMPFDELLEENKQLFADANQVFFLAFAEGSDFDENGPVGVSHGSLRREYVNGAGDGLKGYIEAVYVIAKYRKRGIATGLVRNIEQWAARHGCREVASDCLLDNAGSYDFHTKIGYAETERCIFFLKKLPPGFLS